MTCSDADQAAIDAAVAAGAVVVVAAGNAHLDLDLLLFAPANCGNVVTVSATTRSGELAAYSNYGSIVDVAARGGEKSLPEPDRSMLSLVNLGAQEPILSADGWGYGRKSGTSMAAPHVAGIASLMLAANTRLAPAQVAGLLYDTARPFPVSSSCSADPAEVYYCGAGIVDAAAAVAAADALTEPPSAPHSVKATPAVRSGAVTWSPPETDGGAEITGHVVTANPGGHTCRWNKGPLTCVVSGLDNGATYTFTVVAQNRKGDGPPSAPSAPVMPQPTFRGCRRGGCSIRGRVRMMCRRAE